MTTATRRKNWHGLGKAILTCTIFDDQITRQIETDEFIYTRTEKLFQQHPVLRFDEIEWRALAWFYLETQNDI